jgi:hypothetical protein
MLPDFATRTATEIVSTTDIFSEKLRTMRFLLAGEFIEQIKKIFQHSEYNITPTDSQFHLELSPRGPTFSYAFIVEKFYRFGVVVFSRTQLLHMKNDVNRDVFRYYSTRFFSSIQEANNCIGTFVLFSPDCPDPIIDSLSRSLLSVKGSMPFVFVYQVGQPISDFIATHLNEVDSRRDTVEEHFRTLRHELSEIHSLIVEDSMLITQLNSMISGKYLTGRRRSTSFLDFAATIRNVVDRETRNLSIFERKYEEEKAFVERQLDSFDKRASLPNPTELRSCAARISTLKPKFEPIRHELRYLSDLIFVPYVKGVRPVNPFLLTEPNNIELFVVNQERLITSANEFLHHLLSGGSNCLFLTGAAGTGKTHALRHLFLSHAKKLNIWAIYIDCPMKYDIVSSLMIEILQDRNFPKEIQSVLPSIRKKRVSTELEFLDVMRMLSSLLRSQHYKGLLLVVDELENALPYTYDVQYQGEADKTSGRPLALRQLKGILSSARDIGFVFAFRDHIRSELKANIEMKNFDSMVLSPERLEVAEFKELIKNRYETWKCPRIEFRNDVLRRVVEITNANTRHTIQYFRALYNYAVAHSKRQVTLKTLDSIGELPLFTY